MIRVLNIISDTNIGGAGRVVLNYLKYADREHFETLVAVPRGSLLKEPIEALGIQVYEVDAIADRSYDKEDVAVLQNLIYELKPDIVHTHGTMSGRIAAKRCGVKTVFTRHSVFPVSPKIHYPPGRWINKWANEYYSDRIIAVSPAAAQNLIDGGVSPKKITTIMNGVAAVPRASGEICDALREKWDLKKDIFTAGIMARLEPYKGHLYIIDAVEKLKADGRNIQVLIAGVGAYEQTLREEVIRRGLQNEIIFVGFQTDVAPLLSVMDVQLNASYGTEATSLALLEGLSMGVPAIVSNYGGNPWVIDDGEDGLLFANRSAEGLYQCLRRLMDEPQTLSKMSERAKEIFAQRFTGEIFAANIEKVYREMKG